MDKIHDKANKFFSDVRKKKIKVGNINNRKDNKVPEIKDTSNVSDLTHTSCLYCEKVFISYNYLLKHVLRRHSENFIKLHQRCLQSHSNSDHLKSLFPFLEERFLELKKELLTVKQAVGYKIDNEVLEHTGKDSVEHVHNIIKSPVDSDIAVAGIDFGEIENLKEKMCTIENNIQCLHDKFEDFDTVLKTQVLFRQDFHKHRILNDEKLLGEQELKFTELRQTLLKELNNVLSKQLYENDVEWKSKFTNLKQNIQRIDSVISDIKKEINHPHYVADLEKKLEQQIVNFLGSTRHKANRRKNSRLKNNLPVTKNRSSFQENKKKSESYDFDNQIINSSNNKSLHLTRNQNSNVSYITPEELTFLIAEKLSHFSISPNTTRISCSEYEEKLKLINSDKDYLNKKYHNFSEIYNHINVCANRKVLSKLKNKKLRFSDPLISSKDFSQNLKSNEADFHNKTCPILDEKNNQHNVSDNIYDKIAQCDVKYVSKKHRFAVPESKGFVFPNHDGNGDCSGNFSAVYYGDAKEIFESMPAKKCMTSSPITDTYDAGKAENRISNSYNFLKPSVHFVYDSKIDCASLDNCAKHGESFLKSLKNRDKSDVYDQSSEVDDIDDETSLKSLSSLEEDENSYVTDLNQ